MKTTEKHRYSLRLPKDTGDGFFRYFEDIYADAMAHMKSGNRMRAFQLLKRGSRQYALLFSKGASLSSLIYDDSSLWLCIHYERRNQTRKLNRILKSNFIEYKNNFYHLTTGEVIWRRVPNEELDPQYDFGMDSPQDEETDRIVLELIKEKRGVKQ